MQRDLPNVRNQRGDAEYCGNYKYKQYPIRHSGDTRQTSESRGSGLVIKQDSKYLYIATNNHVVADANSLTAVCG